MLYALGSALLLGVPTVLIPTHLFSRTVPTSLGDYIIWILSALLLGPLLALATLYPTPSSSGAHTRTSSGGLRALAGSVLSFLSIGCPVCNKVIVLLFGFTGALTVFNPLRPFIGLASLLVLGVTLFSRLRVLRYGCPVRFKGNKVHPAP